MSDIKPGLYSILAKKEICENEYPFETLINILNSFSGEFVDYKFEKALKCKLDEFKHHLVYKYNIPNDEIQYFNLNLLTKEFPDSWKSFTLENAINGIKIKCGNLYTACILYNHYIPYFMIRSLEEYTFNDGFKVYYDCELDEYMGKLN